MGRIKTMFIKQITKMVFEKHKDKFTTDFKKNREILEQLIEIRSKKIKNQVAGYITRLMQKEVAAT